MGAGPGSSLPSRPSRDDTDCTDTQLPPGPAHCDNTADLAALGAIDVADAFRDCDLIQCAGAPGNQACVDQCFQDVYGLGSDCAGCFGRYTLCATWQCFCLLPSSASCQRCLTNRCRPAFEACSGIPAF